MQNRKIKKVRIYKKRMKSFNERCYKILINVPKGKVTTYKEIAKTLNCKAYRSVGNAMRRNPYSFLRPEKSNIDKDFPVNKNPYAPEVPCHRVINANGRLGGFASGTKKKIEMLRKEGIEIIDGKIDLNKYLHKF